MDLGKVAHKAIEALGDQVGMGGMVGMLKDHKGWDPVVPADLHTSKLPPVAADGTAECWQCKSRLPFAQLDIANETYVCRPCALRPAQIAAAQQASQVDVDSVKIGRGRWWILPLCFVGAGLVTVAIYFA